MLKVKQQPSLVPSFISERTNLPMYQLTPSTACSILPHNYPRPAHDKPVLCCCAGLGTDTFGYIVGLVERGERPDLFTFADTGAERPLTYEMLHVINDYLSKHGFPPVVVVQLTPPKSNYTTIEENMLENKTMPSIVYQMKSCSLRWKKAPQDEW